MICFLFFQLVSCHRSQDMSSCNLSGNKLWSDSVVWRARWQDTTIFSLSIWPSVFLWEARNLSQVFIRMSMTRTLARSLHGGNLENDRLQRVLSFQGIIEASTSGASCNQAKYGTWSNRWSPGRPKLRTVSKASSI